MKVLQWTGWILLISFVAEIVSETEEKIKFPLVSLISAENSTTPKINESNSTETAQIDFVSELMTALMNSDDKSSTGTYFVPDLSPDTPTTLSLNSNQDSSDTTKAKQSSVSTPQTYNPDEIIESSTLSNFSKILYYDESTTTEYTLQDGLVFDDGGATSHESMDQSTNSAGIEMVNNNRNPFDVIVIDEEKMLQAQALNNTLQFASNGTDEIAESESKLEVATSISKPGQSENWSDLNDTVTDYIIFNDSKPEDQNTEEFDKIKTEYSIDNQTSQKPSEKREPKFAETIFASLLGKVSIKDNNTDQYNHYNKQSNSDTVYGNRDAMEPDVEIVEVFSDAPKTNEDAERNGKSTQGEKTTSFAFSSVRQIHPENKRPNYDYERRPELIDRVRPLHPDPVNQFPYFRPTPDSRTPVVIKEDTESTRVSRPDSVYQRASFKPNYGNTKFTQPGPSFVKFTGTTTSKPYRASFKPYPQSSFGRPYRPSSYPKPSSTTPEDVSSPQFELKDTSIQGSDVSEYSRSDYDYSRHPGFSKNYPTYDSKTNFNAKTTSFDLGVQHSDTSKPSVIYPKPSFGSNYQPPASSGSALSPFAAGAGVGSKNRTKVEFIKADCFNNHMKVTMRFNGSFTGLVYSSGYAQDSSCSYVNGSGRDSYDFYIRLNRCGTIGKQEVPRDRLQHDHSVRDERAQYLVNTITVQYNPVIEEDIDEHFKVTCEYGYDFWKTVTFPMISVESSISKSPALKIRTGSPVVFTLPPPQCNMEIRRGYGLTGSRVSGPVSVGDPLTLIIHMKSESPGFDILVSNCFAHNGAQKRLQLLNSDGCVVENQIVTDFRGVKTPDRRQQVTLYSYLKTFRFTGSPALYIECDVHMCHGTCPSQRCHWRKLFKRSLEENSTSAADSVMSDSVSLFQALEVRHEEVDKPDLLPLRHMGRNDSDDLMCLQTGGFAAILACILLLLVLSTTAAVCMCLRLRKIKRLTQEPDTKHFVEFSGNMSFN